MKNTYSKKAIFANEGRRNATIKTLDFCEMMKLHKDDLAAVLRYPEVASVPQHTLYFWRFTSGYNSHRPVLACHRRKRRGTM
jgi:hypothetical protein